MGWTYTHKDVGQSVKDFFRSEFDWVNEKRRVTVLDCAVVCLREAYIAMEAVDLVNHSREVFAIVCLLDYQPNDYYNFGYKDMEESMGPYNYNCPERILNLLTPTGNEYALKWRWKCREAVERRKKVAKIKNGDILEFEEPIVFQNGCKIQQLQVKDKKKGLFKQPGKAWISFKLKRDALANRPFRVITA